MRHSVRFGVTAVLGAWLLAVVQGQVPEEFPTYAGVRIGERFHYRLYWGVIPVGDLEVFSEWIQEGDRQLVHLVGQARTGPVVSKIYAVDDRVESFVDPETFLPLRYNQDLHEGRKVRRDRVVFRHSEGLSVWRSDITGQEREIPIQPDTRDVLTLLYRMQRIGIAPGDVSRFRVLVDDKLYDLEISGLDRETMRSEVAGQVECLKVEPRARFGEIFVRKGRMQMWFLEDERRWCMRITAHLPIADFRAVLSEVWGDVVGNTNGPLITGAR